MTTWLRPCDLALSNAWSARLMSDSMFLSSGECSVTPRLMVSVKVRHPILSGS